VAKLIILPGTDGTGSLLRPFVEALGPDANVVVVNYPTQQTLGYSELEQLVRPILPTSESFVLLGESFAGPLAISIAASQPVGLVGVVLSASFARYPISWLRPLAPLARLAPVRAVPDWLLAWLLLGRWSTPALLAMLRSALRAVAPSVLRARVVASLRVDASQTLGRVGVPLLYLRASHDRVIGRRAGTELLRWAPHATVSDLPGPHFLLQASPQGCAQVVQRFAAGL
jgi:pimeloyl-[acyl-carrier protein] methyl ester esterase